MKERIFKLIILALLSLAFALTIIIYSFSITMLNDTVTSASIALSQFEYDGVSLYGIFIGSIVLGAFHLVLYIIVFIVDLSLTCINF
jgi:TRAP-type C4-dicarboxylate transport system permease small subunit